MREIKFRGKDEWGNWRHGDLMKNSIPTDSPVIVENFYYDDPDDSMFEVNPDTVGQFTGLKDCEGREIYEGDVVEATLKDKSFVKRFHMDETVTGKISFGGTWWLGEWDALWRLPRYYDLTVIGNIHDNPELLEAHV